MFDSEPVAGYYVRAMRTYNPSASLMIMMSMTPLVSADYEGIEQGKSSMIRRLPMPRKDNHSVGPRIDTGASGRAV